MNIKKALISTTQLLVALIIYLLDYRAVEDNNHITQHTTVSQINMTPTLVDGIKDFKQALLQGKVFNAQGEYAGKELDSVEARYRSLKDMQRAFASGVSLSAQKQQVFINQLIRIAKDIPDNTSKTANKNNENIRLYDFIKEQAINGLKFAANQDKPKLISWQEKLLRAMVGTSFQHLNLRGWLGVTDDILVKLLAASPDLQSLDIRDCPNITWQIDLLSRTFLSSLTTSTWSYINKACPVLTTLKISKLSNFKALEFKQLENLVIENGKMTEFALKAPKLSNLALKAAIYLSKLTLDGLPLKKISLNNRPELSDIDIHYDTKVDYLDKISIKQCEKIKHTKVYQQYPVLFGQTILIHTEHRRQQTIKAIEQIQQQGLTKQEQNILKQTLIDVSANNRLIFPVNKSSKVLPALLQALKDSDSDVRDAAASALGSMSEVIPKKQLTELVEELLQALKDSKWKVRKEAARGLGSISQLIPKEQLDEVVRALLQALKDSDKRVSYAAASALGSMSEVIPEKQLDEVVTALLQALKDSEWWVRQAAARALGSICQVIPKEQLTEVVRALLQALKDSGWWVRKGAASALGSMSQVIPKKQLTEVVRALLQALKDSKEYVRKAAADALGSISQVIPEKQLTELVEELLQALKDSDWRAREGAARALGSMSEVIPKEQLTEVVRALLQALKDSDDGVRQAAVETLGSIYKVIPEKQLTEVVRALLQALKDSKWRLRKAAVNALGIIYKVIPEKQLDEFVRALLQALKDSEWDVRKAAAYALGSMSEVIPEKQLDEFVRALLQALKDSEWVVRKAAADALGSISELIPEKQLDEFVRALLQALKDSEWDVRKEAASALGSMSELIPKEQLDEVVRALLQALKDSNKWVRRGAASALGSICQVIPKEQLTEVVRALLQALKDSYRPVRERALTSIGILTKLLLSIEQRFKYLQNIASKSKQSNSKQQINETNQNNYSIKISPQTKLTNQDSFEVNNHNNFANNQWYDDSKIQQLINSQFADGKQINNLHCATSLQTLDNQLMLATGKQQSALVNSKLPSFIPLHLNLASNIFGKGANHWCLLLLIPTTNNKLLAIYHNPKGIAIHPEIKQQLQNSLGKTLKIIDSQLKQQSNDDDCGPCIVESAVRIINWLQYNQPNELTEKQVFSLLQMPVSNSNGQQLRAKHRLWLQPLNKQNDIYENTQDVLVNNQPMYYLPMQDSSLISSSISEDISFDDKGKGEIESNNIDITTDNLETSLELSIQDKTEVSEDFVNDLRNKLNLN